jgi:sulfonate transport system substrate-binding protein
MRRRTLIATASLGATTLMMPRPSARADSKPVLKIGYQKASVTLVLARAKGTFEAKLNPLGYDVSWAEFTSGPPMLEAMNAGAVNFAFTGEPPVIFAQAAGTPIVYVAATNPSPQAIAILKPAGSPIKSLADLAGKKVAVAKGSSAHFLLVSALAKAGVPYTDVTKIFLQPADARAAFSGGDVDAWSIWDPFYAGAQAAGAQVLTTGTGVMLNRSYYSSVKDFATQHPDALKAAIAVINSQEAWESKHIDETATDISPSIGLPTPTLKTWFARQKYGVNVMTPAIFAGQQKIADAFFKLNLIPTKIDVTQAAWSA